MNEMQRQAYLSAIGLEGYMPRWRLPFAPEPSLCLMPIKESVDKNPIAPIFEMQPHVPPSSRINILKELNDSQPLLVATTPLLNEITKSSQSSISPFALSVWRPIIGMLIIDSRNSALALPTDLLLTNILKVVLKGDKFNLQEEVLRWPMIENRFVSRTETDARNELQTWLAVENELRPINKLWLFGENAAKYFIPPDQSISDSQWKKIPVDGLSENSQLDALVLPSLNHLLSHPEKKAHLWTAIS